MKRQITFSLIFLFSSFSFAQTNVYQPLPGDSACWLWKHDSNNWQGYAWEQWLGDTIINGITYTKRYSFINSSLFYTGGIRQDIPNEKIYEIGLNGPEQDISFDQHLTIGATLVPGGNIYVKSIDSVLVGSNYRKRFHLRQNQGDTTWYKSYICGVGVETEGYWEAATTLYCFSVNNVKMYSAFTGPTCSLILGVNEQPEETDLSVLPNPATNKITILLPSTPIHGHLSIYNLTGQNVLTLPVNSIETVVNVEKLPAGSYFVIYTNKNATTTRKFFVKKID